MELWKYNWARSSQAGALFVFWYWFYWLFTCKFPMPLYAVNWRRNARDIKKLLKRYLNLSPPIFCSNSWYLWLLCLAKLNKRFWRMSRISNTARRKSTVYLQYTESAVFEYLTQIFKIVNGHDVKIIQLTAIFGICEDFKSGIINIIFLKKRQKTMTTFSSNWTFLLR